VIVCVDACTHSTMSTYMCGCQQKRFLTVTLQDIVVVVVFAISEAGRGTCVCSFVRLHRASSACVLCRGV